MKTGYFKPAQFVCRSRNTRNTRYTVELQLLNPQHYPQHTCNNPQHRIVPTSPIIHQSDLACVEVVNPVTPVTSLKHLTRNRGVTTRNNQSRSIHIQDKCRTQGNLVNSEGLPSSLLGIWTEWPKSCLWRWESTRGKDSPSSAKSNCYPSLIERTERPKG